MNDRAVIALLKQNDASAMRTLFDKYHAWLCRLATRIVRDPDQGKDIVQEVFVRIWKNRAQLDITSSLEAYLKKSTINVALNHLKQTERRGHASLETSDLSNKHTVAADQALSTKELQEKTDQAIQALPERTRAVFTLIRHEEMSYKEVSDVLDISTKAVEKEMMKALRLLREALRDYLGHASLIALIVQFAW